MAYEPLVTLDYGQTAYAVDANQIIANLNAIQDRVIDPAPGTTHNRRIVPVNWSSGGSSSWYVPGASANHIKLLPSNYPDHTTLTAFFMGKAVVTATQSMTVQFYLNVNGTRGVSISRTNDENATDLVKHHFNGGGTQSFPVVLMRTLTHDPNQPDGAFYAYPTYQGYGYDGGSTFTLTGHLWYIEN